MPRVLHFGPGNFHRAHQAWYTQNAGGWSITGVSLRSAVTRDALAGQDYDYTLVMQDAMGAEDQRITVIDRILVAPEDPAAVTALVADPETQVITSTVTEKGYHLDAAGQLIMDDAIQSDLAGQGPGTFIGFLAFGIAARQAAGVGPISVVSCDNLSHNGTKLRAAVVAFGQAAGLSLDLDQVAFPNTMVDRITPRPTPALATQVAERTGWTDASPVVTETFSEWIIEDRFAGPHPDWASAGAVFVPDVAPFEMRKLRMLNGAHSMLAYLGHLRGHTYVHQAVADAAIRADVVALMQAAMVTVGGATPALEVYRDALLDRFANPSLEHALLQIAMDGSQKMPIRCVAAIHDLLDARADASAHLKALASWIAFVQQADDLDDPQAAALVTAKTAGDPIAEILSIIDARLPDPALQTLRHCHAGL